MMTAHELLAQAETWLARQPHDLYWQANKLAASTLIGLSLGHARYCTQWSSGTTLWAIDEDGRRFVVKPDGTIHS